MGRNSAFMQSKCSLLSLSDIPVLRMTSCLTTSLLWNVSQPFALKFLQVLIQFFLSLLYFHRIIKWFGSEETLKIILFHLPAIGCPKDKVAQSPVQPSLKHFQGCGIYNLFGQPVLVPPHPHSKDFYFLFCFLSV